MKTVLSLAVSALISSAGAARVKQMLAGQNAPFALENVALPTLPKFPRVAAAQAPVIVEEESEPVVEVVEPEPESEEEIIEEEIIPEPA